MEGVHLWADLRMKANAKDNRIDSQEHSQQTGTCRDKYNKYDGGLWKQKTLEDGLQQRWHVPHAAACWNGTWWTKSWKGSHKMGRDETR